jgi:PAS domain S-box-containing protein
MQYHDERAALEALRESEERFRQLAENIREVFWMTDAEGTKILYISPAYEAIWGRSRASLIAGPASWLDAVHPADRARVEAKLAEPRDVAAEATYRIVRPDGSERWIRGRSFPVRDDDGTLRRVVGLAEDVTELMQTQERLRRAQRLEALGLLAGGVAHDFNNLLSIIVSYTDFLREQTGPHDPRRGDLDQIRAASERAMDLTRQLLAFGRSRPLESRTIDLREVLRGLAQLLRRLVRRDVSLVVAHPAALGAVRADQGGIEQVILNLVVNANDAMPHGGRLTIQTSNVALHAVEAAALGVEMGDYVALTVSDEGVGMDEATLTRVFEPFFTTKEIGKGTGLGLSTALGVVRQAGGAIRVRSAPGQGSSFEALFPCMAASAPVCVATEGSSLVDRGTETILVVEDEDQVRAVACAILRRAGYAVLEARSAGDAVLICEQYPAAIDLLLADVVMPFLRGPELALRLASQRPRMRVLFMSGHSQASLLDAGRGDGAAPFVQKPITPETLCRRVRDVLDAADVSAR